MTKDKIFHTSKQLIIYGLAASVGLAVDFGVLILSKELLGLHYLLAVAAGFISGLIVVFLLSNRFVFGTPKGSLHSIFLLFAFIGLIGLVILEILVWFFAEELHLNYLLSKAIATIFVFMWNFFARKTLYQEKEIEIA